MYENIFTPSVIVDLDVADRNIKSLINNAKKYGVRHRPHIKAHKSVYFARNQLAAGASGITCAKLGEAEVMAEYGIQDILIAYPLLGRDKMARLYRLLKRADIKTMVNSIRGAQDISSVGEKLGKKVSVLIEIDGGVNRGGLQPGKDIIEFANKIRNLAGIDINGLLYYGGNIYRAKDEEKIIEMTKREGQILLETKKILEEEGFKIKVLSGGSSFSSKFPQYLSGITEVRAGNYIFNDCAQLPIGLVNVEDCSLRIIATVVSVMPASGTAIIDAGSKTLTTDLAAFRKGYGYIVEYPAIEIYKLNEEHGFLTFDDSIKLRIGQKLSIIPNHACVIPNLCDEILGMRNGSIEQMIKIEARGKNK